MAASITVAEESSVVSGAAATLLAADITAVADSAAAPPTAAHHTAVPPATAPTAAAAGFTEAPLSRSRNVRASTSRHRTVLRPLAQAPAVSIFVPWLD